MPSKKLSRHIAQQLGINIKEVRESRGFSREDLALMLGMTYQQLYKYETAQNKISAEQIILVKHMLGTTYQRLFKGFK